jgi:RimJ/RimL family protein N-acetyltransferase
MTTSQDIRSKTSPELLTSTGQTYLIGEHIYLRSIVPADAEYGSAWRDTVFPQAPERVRGWIIDDLTGSGGPGVLIIVNKASDRPVGSVRIDFRNFPHHEVTAHVDPLDGDRGLVWKGEALALTMTWLIDELQRPKAGTDVPAHETPVLDALAAVGARTSARFRERLALPGGGRDDALVIEYFNPAWIERLGDPNDEEFPRTGSGEPRPVTAPLTPVGDPPANAMRIGPRVYLRPPQESDARAMAHWSAREIDPSWDNGRSPVGREGANKWFRDFQKDTPPGTIDFAVCLRETDEFLGLVGVMDIDYRHGYGESASMILNPRYREAGYGSEAKHLMFDHVFNTVGLHSLQSWVMFQNPRSAAALRKQGYKEAGRDHWIENRDGRFVSFVAFDLLASDWRAMPRYDAGDADGSSSTEP